MRKKTPILADRAHSKLRRAIVTCTLSPGAAFSEATLCARHGLTLASARAALARLRAEGLVIARPRSGHIVTPITPTDVRDIFALRRVLQGHAAEEAACRADPEVLRARDAACTAAEGRRAAFIAANNAFHLAVAAAAGNARLTVAIRDLLDHAERLHHLGLRRRQGSPMPPWRAPLIAAIVARDPAAARAATLTHLAAVERMALEAVATEQ